MKSYELLAENEGRNLGLSDKELKDYIKAFSSGFKAGRADTTFGMLSTITKKALSDEAEVVFTRNKERFRWEIIITDNQLIINP